MIDVGAKDETRREAVAEGRIRVKRATVEMVQLSTLPKGNALETARVAAIMAAKNTPQMIPLCHPLLITHVGCEFVCGFHSRHHARALHRQNRRRNGSSHRCDRRAAHHL
jgi:molybdenum cofactor biosynthesis protein MoaC